MSDLRARLLLDLKDGLTSPMKAIKAAYLTDMRAMMAATADLRKKLTDVGKSIKDAAPMKLSLGIAAFGGVAVKTAASVEDMMSALETATGSQTAASAAFAEINQFARTTPYDLAQVTNSYIKLKNLGLDPSMESLNSFGNTASAMNKSLDQMIEAVADAATGEYERLKEFGIKASTQGKKVTFTFQGVKTTIKNDAASIQEYLKSIGDVNFGGAMEKKMTNFSGVWSNFMDTISGTMNMAGLQIMESLKIKDFLNDLADTVQKVTDAFMALSPGLRDAIVIGGLFAMVLGPIMMTIGQIVIGIGGLVWALSILGPAFMLVLGFIKAFSIGLLTTPVGWFMMGIAAIAGGVYLIYKNWGAISGWFSNLWTGIKATFSDAIDVILNILSPLIKAIQFVMTAGSNIGSAILGGLGRKPTGSPSPMATGPAAPISGGARSGVDMGGTLNIKIDSDGQARVQNAAPNDKRMDYSVDTGLLMGAPG